MRYWRLNWELVAQFLVAGLIALPFALIGAFIIWFFDLDDPGERPLPAELPSLEIFRDKALEEWGVSGMAIDIRYGTHDELTVSGQTHGGLAWPTDGFRACTILVNDGFGDHPDLVWDVVLHEVGHCVGHWGHSEEPGSIMRSSAYGGHITAKDRLTVIQARSAELSWRVVVPILSTR